MHGWQCMLIVLYLLKARNYCVNISVHPVMMRRSEFSNYDISYSHHNISLCVQVTRRPMRLYIIRVYYILIDHSSNTLIKLIMFHLAEYITATYPRRNITQQRTGSFKYLIQDSACTSATLHYIAASEIVDFLITLAFTPIR